MIKREIYFKTAQPITDEGVRLCTKQMVRDEILRLLDDNGYSFFPFSRPVPPILANPLQDVKYSDLIYMLRQVYNYCEQSDEPNMTIEHGVVLKPFGVYEIASNSRYLKVTFTDTNDKVLPLTKQVPEKLLPYIISDYCDSCSGTNTQAMVIVEAV